MPSALSVANDLIAQAVRARQRRMFMLGAQQDSLSAMAVVESQIERNVKALALLPSAAEQAFATQSPVQHSLLEQDALVHVRGAFLAQLPPSQPNKSQLLSYLQQHLAKHPVAVRDALWFFPMERELFSPRDQHLDLLLNSSGAAIGGLGIELVGRHASLRHTPHVTRLAQNKSDASRRACDLALARCGVLPQPETAIRNALKSGQVQHALRLVAATGLIQVLGCADYLHLTRHPDPQIQRHAWLLASLCDPLTTVKQAQNTDMDARLRAHVLALSGYIPDLIDTLRDLAFSDKPPEPFQREHLLLTLGSLDASLDVLPVDSSLRDQALRRQLLSALRQSHLGIHNDADIAPWTCERIVLSESLRDAPRLRYGQRHKSKPTLDQRMADLGSALRQALYIEYAARAGAPQSLSASSPARVQRTALGTVQWATEHLEPSA